MDSALCCSVANTESSPQKIKAVSLKLAPGIERLSTHCMRYTYRAWLDAVGTFVAVQQKLMRHADIRTTMNVYGDVVTDEMVQAA
jgi:integrase